VQRSESGGDIAPVAGLKVCDDQIRGGVRKGLEEVFMKLTNALSEEPPRQPQVMPQINFFRPGLKRLFSCLVLLPLSDYNLLLLWLSTISTCIHSYIHTYICMCDSHFFCLFTLAGSSYGTPRAAGVAWS
jgi:hypothetical protein